MQHLVSLLLNILTRLGHGQNLHIDLFHFSHLKVNLKLRS